MTYLETESELIEALSRKLSTLSAAKTRGATELSKAAKTLSRAQHAQETLQRLAQAMQQRAHEKIAQVVSLCLSTVFEDPYTFVIEFERKRGRTEAQLRFVRNGLHVDPMTASGGGVVDVAAFALRVACLMLHRPRLSRLLVLDEPFKYVSAQYQDNVRTMLEKLSQDLGLQIIMVTHNSNLATGKIVELD